MQKRFERHAGLAIGPILFVVAILAVLVGAIAAGSGGFGSSTAAEAAKIRASTIIQQGINIKGAFDRIVVNGIVTTAIVTSETLNTAASALTALYGVAGGGLTPQVPPQDTVSGAAPWRYVVDADLPGIGNAGDNDSMAILQVSLLTCNALNAIIFGRDAYSTPPALDTDAVVTISNIPATDAVTPIANAFNAGTTPPAAIQGRSNACVANGTNYYYYQMLFAG